MNPEPHVFHLHSSAGVYGAEYVLLGLIPALAKRGVRSTLLCIDNPLLQHQPLFERACALGVPVERIACAGRLDFSTARAIRARISGSTYPLLHVHGYKSAFYAWLARRGLALPIVATLHGPVSITSRLRLYMRIERWLLRRFQMICVVSARMQADLLTRGIPAGKICLIENGIDTERFRPDVAPLQRGDHGIPADTFLFGAAMRLSEEKNPLGLLESFSMVAHRFPRAWLTIAGDGPLRAEASSYAESLGISGRVRFLGSRDDLEHYYPMLDCFVLPSHYEGLPMALLEAMAAARPVVSTDVGQVGTVLDGLGCRLTAPRDMQALASAMHAALEEGRRSLPELRRRVCERYSAEKMAQNYAHVYRDLWRSDGYAFA